MTPDDPKSAAANKESPHQSFEYRALHKAAVDLLIRFHIVWKIAKIYNENNEIFQEQIKILFHALQDLLAKEKKAVFRVRQGSLFFNEVRLKFVLTTYPIFKFVLEELRRREVGVMGFLPGIDQEELIGFISLLAKKDKAALCSFEELLDEVEETGYSHISLEKILPTDSLVSAEKKTARIYFLSIYHLKETFEKYRGNSKIRLGTTKRLMQSIFNHVGDNESFICGLTNVKNHDEYTLNHSVNVCMLSIALGRRLGLTRTELVDLGMAAFFHDLGKLETPLEILNKPAKLSEEEREIIEKHPFQGAEKLMQFKEFKHLPFRAIHVALEHHIKEDFSGYPNVFNKETTNFFSKIVKVVDYFDAITTKRVYRKNVFTRAEALSLMLDEASPEFHPVILKAFVNMMGIYPIGTLVSLNTNEVGIVFDINPENQYLMRPKVKIIADEQGRKIDGDIADLSEKDPATGRFLRTIAKPLDPEKYGIHIPDYFLSQAR